MEINPHSAVIDILSLARELGTSLQKPRREEVLRTAEHKVLTAVSVRDIKDALAEAASELFKDVIDLCFAIMRGGVLEIEYHRQTRGLCKLPRDAGYVGRCIKRCNQHYQANLRPEDPVFVPDPDHPAPRSVFTLFFKYLWQGLPGAVQVQCGSLNACPNRSDRSAFADLAYLCGQQAEKLLLQDQLRNAQLRVPSSDDWRGQVLDVIFAKGRDLSTILKTKREVMKRFAGELRRVAGEDHCIAASIRVLNPLKGVLAYVVCNGPAWTPEARETRYPLLEKSACSAAMTSDRSIYYESIDESKPFERILPATCSLWARRFIVRGVPSGVVSVDWDREKIASTELIQQLESLTTQFEAVLDVIGAEEESLFRRLETDVRLKYDLYDLGKRLAHIFDARNCALFVDRENKGQLRLEAHTHLKDAKEVQRQNYPHGEGIIGWVAKHRWAVAIQDPTSEEELKQMQLRCHMNDSTWPEVTSRVPNEGNGVLAAPMVSSDRVLAVIRLDGLTFTDARHEDEVFLQEIATSLAREFDRAWIEEEAAERLKDLEKSQQTTHQLYAGDNLDQSAKAILEDVNFRSGAEGGYLRVIDTSNSLASLQSYGRVPLVSGFEPPLPLSALGLDRDIWGEKSSWRPFAEWIRQQIGPQSCEIFRHAAYIKLLDTDPHVEAGLWLCFRSLPQWTDTPERSALFFARHRANAERPLRQALRIARLARRLDEEHAVLARLQGIAFAYAGAENLNDLANEVCGIALEGTGLQKATIRLYDLDKDEWTRIAPSRLDPAEFTIFPEVLSSNNALGACRSSQNAILWSNVQSISGWRADWERETDERRREFLRRQKTWVTVPLRAGGVFLGGIFLQSDETVYLQENKLAGLDLLAAFASAAIHSTHAKQKEFETIEPFLLIGELLGGLLHQIRNEVTAARGYLEVVTNRHRLPDDSTSLLEKLAASLRTIRNVSQDLVSFDPKTAQVPEPLHLSDLLDEAWNEVSRGFNLEGIEIQQQYSEPSWTMGNRVQIQAAFRMLIQNAIEALSDPRVPTSRRRIQLKTDTEKSRIVVTVSDSGCGMDAATQSRAFKPLFTTKAHGSGLGLAIVWHVARRHEGEVKIHSEPGTGTEVSLWFPMKGRVQ
jgi:signal transduction histidine kinase